MSVKNNNFTWKDGVSLRDYFESKLKAMDERLNLHLKLNNVALEKADDRLNVRLEGMNEFRKQLNNQANTFVDKNLIEEKLNRINEDIRSLRESRALLEGKASTASVYISYTIALTGIIIAILSLVI